MLTNHLDNNQANMQRICYYSLKFFIINVVQWLEQNVILKVGPINISYFNNGSSDYVQLDKGH